MQVMNLDPELSTTLENAGNYINYECDVYPENERREKFKEYYEMYTFSEWVRIINKELKNV